MTCNLKNTHVEFLLKESNKQSIPLFKNDRFHLMNSEDILRKNLINTTMLHTSGKSPFLELNFKDEFYSFSFQTRISALANWFYPCTIVRTCQTNLLLSTTCAMQSLRHSRFGLKVVFQNNVYDYRYIYSVTDKA